MDAAGIITGAIVAMVAGFVIPFLTTQFSVWADKRRSLIDDRRAALNALLQAETNVYLNVAVRADHLLQSGTTGHAGATETDNAEIRVRRILLQAMFTTSDTAVKDLFSSTQPENPNRIGKLTPDVTTVLATWAAGRDRRARWAANRLLKEQRQEAVGTPKDRNAE